MDGGARRAGDQVEIEQLALFLAASAVATALAVWRIQETRDVDLTAEPAPAGPAGRSFLERA